MWYIISFDAAELKTRIENLGEVNMYERMKEWERGKKMRMKIKKKVLKTEETKNSASRFVTGVAASFHVTILLDVINELWIRNMCWKRRDERLIA